MDRTAIILQLPKKLAIRRQGDDGEHLHRLSSTDSSHWHKKVCVLRNAKSPTSAAA